MCGTARCCLVPRLRAPLLAPWRTRCASAAAAARRGRAQTPTSRAALTHRTEGRGSIRCTDPSYRGRQRRTMRLAPRSKRVSARPLASQPHPSEAARCALGATCGALRVGESRQAGRRGLQTAVRPDPAALVQTTTRVLCGGVFACAVGLYVSLVPVCALPSRRCLTTLPLTPSPRRSPFLFCVTVSESVLAVAEICAMSGVDLLLLCSVWILTVQYNNMYCVVPRSVHLSYTQYCEHCIFTDDRAGRETASSREHCIRGAQESRCQTRVFPYSAPTHAPCPPATDPTPRLSRQRPRVETIMTRCGLVLHAAHPHPPAPPRCWQTAPQWLCATRLSLPAADALPHRAGVWRASQIALPRPPRASTLRRSRGTVSSARCCVYQRVDGLSFRTRSA